MCSVNLWGVGWGMLALAIAWYNVEKMKHGKDK
jgi:hypothetical protein